MLQALTNRTTQTAELGKPPGTFAGPAQNLAGALSGFAPAADKFATSLERMPTEMDHQHKLTVDVNVNGGEAFNTMRGEVEKMLASYVTRAVSKALESRFP